MAEFIASNNFNQLFCTIPLTVRMNIPNQPFFQLGEITGCELIFEIPDLIFSLGVELGRE